MFYFQNETIDSVMVYTILTHFAVVWIFHLYQNNNYF